MTILRKQPWPYANNLYILLHGFGGARSVTVIVVGKWTRRYEFKSWMSLTAFHIAQNTLGNTLQLWVNSGAGWVLQPWLQSVQEKENLKFKPTKLHLKIALASHPARASRRLINTLLQVLLSNTNNLHKDFCQSELSLLTEQKYLYHHELLFEKPNGFTGHLEANLFFVNASKGWLILRHIDICWVI